VVSSINNDHLKSLILPYQPNIDIATFLSRPQLINTYTINTSGIITAAAIDPFYAWKSVPGIANKLLGYLYFKGTCHLQFRYPGNPHAIGTMLWCWCPYTGYFTNPEEYSTDWLFDQSRYHAKKMCLPNVIMPMNANISGELVVPMTSTTGKYSLTGPVFTGQIGYSFLIPYAMDDGTTPPATAVQLYCWFTDVELYNATLSQGFEEKLDKEAKPYAKQVGIKTPISTALRLGSELAESFGYSRPSMPPLNNTIITHNTPLSYISGTFDSGEVLSSSPYVYRQIDSSNFTFKTPGMTSIAKLASTYGYIKSNSSISTSTTSAYTIIAVPWACNSWTASTLRKACIDMNPLAFVSTMFFAWSGKLTYKFIVDCTSFTRAQLGVYVVPTGVSDGGTNIFNPSLGFESKVIDVAGRTEFEIEVQYDGVLPVAANNIGAVTGAPGPQIRIFTLSTIQSPGGSVTALPILAMVKAGPDFSLSGRTLTLLNPYTPSTLISSNYPLAQGLNETLTGETFDSLVEITRGSTFNCAITYTTGTIVFPLQGLIPSKLVNPFGLTIPAYSWTYSTYVPLAYYQSSGSRNFSIRPHDTATYTPLQLVNYPNDIGVTLSQSETPYGLSVQTVGGSKVFAQVRVTDMSYLYFTPVSCLTALASTDTGESFQALNIYPLNPATVTGFDIYHSGGDDFTFDGFIGAPLLTTT
jgi:hypothetical protein